MPTPPIPPRIKKRANPWLAVGLGLFGIAAFSYPFWLRQVTENNNSFDGSKPLPPGTSMRGAYMNSGSRDVGPDPTQRR